MVYLKYVENVIPLSKLIGLLFLFCLPLLSILFLKTKRNDLARPVIGTIFLVSREISIEHPSVGLASLAQKDLLHGSACNMYRLLHAFECNTDITSRVNGEVISRGEAECNLAISE